MAVWILQHIRTKYYLRKMAQSCLGNRVFRFFQRGSIGRSSLEPAAPSSETAAESGFPGFGGPEQSLPHRQKTGEANVTA